MAHVKIFSPSGWDFHGQPIVTAMKLGRDGRFGPNDRADFVKRAGVAGQNIFEKEITRLKFAKDTLPVHLIALGAGEAYGQNRNGDYFDEGTLKEAHDTFVKYGYWFRNHKNKKAEGHPHFGCIKCSAYNPQMRRVELLVELPMTKSAAEFLGCDGPATDEVEKIARGEDLAVSMACRVPYDICSGCGNKARTREEYCKEASCKYGGCLNNLTKMVKIAGDVHTLHVRNVRPTFFDISKVWRPADRIAYAGSADWVKQAGDAEGHWWAGGSKMAEDLGVTAPLQVIMAEEMHPGWRPEVQAMVKIAYGLSVLEQRPELAVGPEVRRAFAADVQPEIPMAKLELDSGRAEKVAAALGALADKKIILSLREFGRLTKRASLVGDAAQVVHGAVTRMIGDGSLEKRLNQCPFIPTEKLASAKQRQAAAELVSTHSLEKSAVDRRCVQSLVRGHQIPVSKSTFGNEKKAHDSVLAEELARDYACYKVAALERISRFDDEFMLTARLSACQNQVI